MQNADVNPWDGYDFDQISEAPAPLNDIPLFYEDPQTIDIWLKKAGKKKGLLSWLWGGAACTCGVGASHVMCVVIPAVTGSASGGIGGLLASSAAMYALSPTIAIAANVGIDRYRNIRRDSWSQAKSMAISAVVAIGVTAGFNAVSGHDHLDQARLGALSQEFLAGERDLYDNMPEDLKQAVEVAAKDIALSPAEYIAICSGTDELGQKISQFRRDYWGQSRATLSLEPQ